MHRKNAMQIRTRFCTVFILYSVQSCKYGAKTGPYLHSVFPVMGYNLTDWLSPLLFSNDHKQHEKLQQWSRVACVKHHILYNNGFTFISDNYNAKESK